MSPLVPRTANEFIPSIAVSIYAQLAQGETTTDAIELGGCNIVGLSFPVQFSGTQISFAVSNNGGAFGSFKNAAGNLVVVKAVAGDAIGIIPADFAAWRWVKIISDTPQVQDGFIEIITRGLA